MCAFFGSPLLARWEKRDGRNSAPFDLAQQTTYNSILWSLCFNNVQKLWQNSSYTTFLYVGKQNSIIPREQLCCEGALTLVCNNSVAFTSQKGTNLPSKDKATLLYDIANFLLELYSIMEEGGGNQRHEALWY